MGGVNFYSLAGVRLDPAAQNAAAREDQRMHAAAVDHGKFQVAIKRGGCYRLPSTQHPA